MFFSLACPLFVPICILFCGGFVVHFLVNKGGFSFSGEVTSYNSFHCGFLECHT